MRALRPPKRILSVDKSLIAASRGLLAEFLVPNNRVFVASHRVSEYFSVGGGFRITDLTVCFVEKEVIIFLLYPVIN
ncbi:Uncharacterised protein [Yersinia enterocolitica]|nr:Uncharacterised protein [Yersinia enterocolitica]CNE20447.1 Uncharacterised protein [Yersinia enterocolitica]